MKNVSDKRASKLLLIALIVIFVYLAFFQFDLAAAYDYTAAQLGIILPALGF